MQLRTADGRVHLLRREGSRFREVTSQVDWSSYDGQLTANRFSALKQIDRTNVAKLKPRWIFSMPDTPSSEMTPLVHQGIMYVTSGNECYALDAGTGRQIWHYQRQRTKGQGARVNRGAALAGDRVFMVTDDARLIALNRFTGELLWDTVMADYRENYFATSAPLIAGDLVIPGIGGGDSGVRGFLAAFDQRTGKEAWRFWTIPAAGEAGSETWNGKGMAHPGGATWFTGSYDPELKLLYWQVGNPGPDHNGDQREGDNLYSDSVVALDVQTGKLKWHYQFTPHDVWDWDAQEPLVLADTVWQGQPRKLMLQANRNGFFYVLDRTNGKLLLGKPFANKVTWAKEIAAERAAGQKSRSGADRERHQDLPRGSRGHELVVRCLRSFVEPLLHSDDRELRDLFEARRRVGSGTRLHGRQLKERTERSSEADSARARYQHGKGCVGAAAGWIRRITVRNTGHRRGAGFLWRG